MIKEMMENDKQLAVISTEIYNKICNNILDYMLSFSSNDEVIQMNYQLKREHINSVIGYTEVLTRSLELDSDMVQAAQLSALLHDIGRFEQFKQFQTFNDHLSVDHAQLAVELIEKHQWLSDLPENFQTAIATAVLHHNKLSMPKNMGETALQLCQIIRDADKIDILKLAVKEYSSQNSKRNPFFSLELADSTQVSKPIAKAILTGRLPDKKAMKTITDFKLLQMAFVFDVNYKKTFSIINKKQLLKQLFDTLPKNDQVFEIYRKAKIHVENQLI
jgi:HD superfamily phosphodiesterase